MKQSGKFAISHQDSSVHSSVVEHMSRVQGVQGSNPAGIWQSFRFVIPYF